MKLISPDFHNDANDKFEISISAPREAEADEKLKLYSEHEEPTSSKRKK